MWIRRRHDPFSRLSLPLSSFPFFHFSLSSFVPPFSPSFYKKNFWKSSLGNWAPPVWSEAEPQPKSNLGQYLHGSYGQGKSGKVREKSKNQAKSGNLKVSGCKSWQKRRKKIWAVLHNLRTTVQNFSCLLHTQIICISTFKFVPPLLFLVWLQAIENRHWYFAWTN